MGESEPIVGWRVWEISTFLRSPSRGLVWPIGKPMTLSDYGFAPTCPGHYERSGQIAYPSYAPHPCSGWAGIHAFSDYWDTLGFLESYIERWLHFKKLEVRRFAPSLGSIAHPPYVLGEVNLWGRVMRHEKGYRGEFAYPKSLYAEGPLEGLIKTVASDYGVETHPCKKRMFPRLDWA